VEKDSFVPGKIVARFLEPVTHFKNTCVFMGTFGHLPVISLVAKKDSMSQILSNDIFAFTLGRGRSSAVLRVVLKRLQITVTTIGIYNRIPVQNRSSVQMEIVESTEDLVVLILYASILSLCTDMTLNTLFL